jgi:TfoX/Sxy family transcriptional regulator of competence genes
MAYDDHLARRIRAAIGDLPGLVEKKMFGGVGFLVNGNMACGVHKDALIVRIGAERYQDALARPHAAPFDMTGRPMTGWVSVAPAGCDSAEALRMWVQQALDFALTLPPSPGAGTPRGIPHP